MKNISLSYLNCIQSTSAINPMLTHISDAFLGSLNSPSPPFHSFWLEIEQWALTLQRTYLYSPRYFPPSRHCVSPSRLPYCRTSWTLQNPELLSHDYWWPGLATFIKNYVDGCAICQQNKVNTHPSSPPLFPIPAPIFMRPFTHCSTDLITNLPLSDGFDSIMVIVDHRLLKGVILTPCNETIDTEGVANIFFSKVFSRFGLYNKIISDHGPQFASRFQIELGRLLDTRIPFPPCFISKAMARLNELTKNLKSTFISFAQTTRQAGHPCSLLLNLFIIHSIILREIPLHSTSWWATTQNTSPMSFLKPTSLISNNNYSCSIKHTMKR